MSVPTDPTIDDIVSAALINAGRTNASTDMINYAKANQFQDVKSDIGMNMGITFPDVFTELVTHTVIGSNVLTAPSIVGKLIGLTFLHPGIDPGYTGDVVAATGSDITLASTLDEADTNRIIGKRITIPVGPGLDQMVQMTGWNNTTKIAIIPGTWKVTPTTASDYIVTTSQDPIFRQSLTDHLNRVRGPRLRGRPNTWAPINSTGDVMSAVDDTVMAVQFDYIPDKVYPIIWTFYADLSQLDEVGMLLKKILRKYRSTWVQGVTTYLMQHFDDGRFLSQWQIYQGMLEMLSGKTARIVPMRYRDI